MTRTNQQHTYLVCIVIPVYKSFSELNRYELASVRQCFTVLHSYPVFFVGPPSLQWLGYEQFCKENNFPFNRQCFNGYYFENLEGYNSLMMNIDFYDAFSKFQYMLVYQTDCYVFRDELAAWCRRGYDYIGAPWIGISMAEWFQYPWYPKKLVYMYNIFKTTFVHLSGNGGLSLRNISSLLRNLERFRITAKNWQAYEDSFFSHYVGTLNPLFRIPGLKTALQFSFDTNPAKAYELNHNQLPFACHAWFRNEKPHYEHNFAFWEPFIKNQLI